MSTTIDAGDAETYHEFLVSLDACGPAVKWSKGKSFREAWALCRCGDWMIWLPGELGMDQKTIVRCTCDFARLSLPYADSDVALDTIKIVEAWCIGEATIEEVRVASSASSAASAVSWAASAASAAARADVLNKCADIVRKYFPADEVEQAIIAKLEGK